MDQPIRVRVCSVTGTCVPVRFDFRMVGDAVCIDSDDVNEVVSAIYAADDDIETEDNDE